MSIRTYILEKIQVLIENHYQLYRYSNGAKYLKFFRIGWTFLNPNPNLVYNMTTSILQLILLIIFNRNWPIYHARDYFHNQILLLLQSKQL